MYVVPKGTKDVLPSESYKWHYVENAIRRVSELFSLKEIRTPIFEHTELFLRGVGNTTDIVNKEMYTFEDKGGRSITLKPEGTAGVARSVLENSLTSGALPLKMYYITPVFRYEQPQAGRFREHHQFGAEIYGADTAECDAETILIAKTFFDFLGLKDIYVKINSIGCHECRPKYNAELTRYYTARAEEICNDCKKRLYKNPLRLLDCKNPECKKLDLPKITDWLCGDCKNRFAELQELLKALSVPFEVDANIVRGLDYYTGLVFEFIDESIGAQSTVCGGGRYNGLTEELGGEQIPAAGFGMGIERLIAALENAGLMSRSDKNPRVYTAPIGKSAGIECLKIVKKLRDAGVAAETDILGRSLKAQMKYADKINAEYVVAVGGDELERGKFTIKNMKNHEKYEVDLNGIYEFFSNHDK
jgi:histidyl-tRNA synthetase